MRKIGFVVCTLLLGFGLASGCLVLNVPEGEKCSQEGLFRDDDPTDCKREVCQGGVFVEVQSAEDDNPCTDDTCVNEKAQHAPTSGGICLMGQIVGSCVEGVCAITCNGQTDCDDQNPCTTDTCNAKNLCEVVRDDSLVPDDGNPCTKDSCKNGAAMHGLEAEGTPCEVGGTCDAMGTCIECIVSSDCAPGFTCAMNQCFSCSDGMKNGTETDVDCGGDCDRCTEGKACNVPADCYYDVCNPDQKCGGCSDGIKNGAESDVDCGSDTCKDCGDGKACNTDADCASHACYDGVCCNAVCDGTCYACNQPGKVGLCAPLPMFTDDTMPDCSGIMTCNGGGSCKLDNGQSCVSNVDCASNICAGGNKICQP
ncbi:hypothetical protein [Polyangium aurulentum]|uniref:hypothetical protein n=1 Tax=Polyangium aurulentum TaxID=2567896 RepID=UPI0010ADC80F|nr:hypothetical protein [Polyangium aurulentum]UQA55704.1 hypothetical protein E8A73_030765 [Polyangium aurulentum]